MNAQKNSSEGGEGRLVHVVGAGRDLVKAARITAALDTPCLTVHENGHPSGERCARLTVKLRQVVSREVKRGQILSRGMAGQASKSPLSLRGEREVNGPCEPA